MKRMHLRLACAGIRALFGSENAWVFQLREDGIGLKPALSARALGTYTRRGAEMEPETAKRLRAAIFAPPGRKPGWLWITGRSEGEFRGAA